MALLDNIPGWKVFSTGIGIAALVVIGYFAYVWFIKGPDDLKELQQQAVNNALDQLAKEYEEKVRLYGEQVVVVMPVRGQETSEGQIRYMIIDRLKEVEGVRADVPRDPSLDERATKVIKGIFEKEDGAEGPDPTEVFKDSGEADEVLAVTVDKLTSTADNGVCIIDFVRIVRDESSAKRDGKIDGPKRITGRSGAAAVDGEEEADTGPGFWSGFGKFMLGLLIVLAMVAILPFLSWPLAKAAFKADSNAANGGLLVGLTVLDLTALFVISWLFAESAFNTTAVVSAALLLPVALVWNLRLLNFIEEQ